MGWSSQTRSNLRKCLCTALCRWRRRRRPLQMWRHPVVAGGVDPGRFFAATLDGPGSPPPATTSRQPNRRFKLRFLQCGAIPFSEERGRIVNALRELEEHFVGRRGGADRIIRQNKFAERRIV